MPKALILRVPGGRKEVRKHPTPNLGLGYLAGVAEQEKYDISIIEGHVWMDAGYFSEEEKISERIKFFIKETEKEAPDVLGISVINSDLAISIEFAKLYKKKHPKTLVIFGGMGINGISKIVSRYIIDSIDIIVEGEGEETFREILQEFRKGKKMDFSKIKGISYLSKNKWHHNEKRPFIQNLDTLPIVNLSHYKKLPPHTIYLLEVERGCPGNCRFCFVTKTWGRGRYFSLQHIDKQIKAILSFQKNPNRIAISDSNLMADKDRGIEVLKFLSLNYPKFIGNVNLRVDQVDDQILDLFQRFKSIAPLVGIESFSPSVLKYLGKTNDPTHYIKQTNWMISEFKKRKILYILSFIFHVPGETEEDIEQLYRFLTEQPEELCVLIYLSSLWLEGNTDLWELYTQGETDAYCVNKKNFSVKLGNQYDDIIFSPFNYWIRNPNVSDKYYIDFLEKVRAFFESRKTILRS